MCVDPRFFDDEEYPDDPDNRDGQDSRYISEEEAYEEMIDQESPGN